MAASWTTVAGSWGAIVIIILGWYYYSKDGSTPKRDGKQQQQQQQQQQPVANGSVANGSVTESLNEPIPQPNPQKQQKQRRKGKKTSASNVVEEVNNAKSTAPVESAKQVLTKRKNADTKIASSAQSSSVDRAPDQINNIHKESDTDVKEFAQRMSKAIAGTDLSKPEKDTKHARTQKLTKINGSFGSDSVNGNNIYSSTSSNTGGDADDDLSSANSPGLSAITSPADTTGISDMLETPGPGPVSLRITEPLMPSKPKAHHVKKQEVTETKKQRQNRLKREREREANREAEAQRKVLEEKQRRTAREAEGRPAKNGNGWTYNSGLPANVWTNGKVQTQTVPAANNINGALLDTTEDSPKPPTITDNTSLSTSRKTNGIKGSASQWDDNLPSEEEQMRLIQEQSEESEWTTVSQPKRTKRKQQVEV